MVDIDILRKMNRPEKIALTKHARERLAERAITIDDIVNGIDTGEVIKQYEDDKPLPSCLVLGLSVNNKYIHIVVSNDEEYIYIITAYYPDPQLWSDDFKTRKGR
ncbi:DUF4258 domain-containing protein [Butyribacter intestini]|uniref:DUF4258 domain-containing protein n=1 Tax=Butyribacter intestini TaxID=1703332 RepID=A0AAW3JTY1_9FIRM|nr:DUF4258 domain-containing protein [Butyribacter intestini]KQC86014.1 hypothetical protein APZ18_02130 [Butyribacter intestini]RHU77118.1 DUF4258 domain-containing protein [Butyribacter intestini]DAV57249.1 MAG TPA: protein of unknown function (DUF4258) [Caudoviricetes sp.]